MLRVLLSCISEAATAATADDLFFLLLTLFRWSSISGSALTLVLGSVGSVVTVFVLLCFVLVKDVLILLRCLLLGFSFLVPDKHLFFFLLILPIETSLLRVCTC